MVIPPQKYWAFISYSHQDERAAKALQRALETYRLPRLLVGTHTAAGEVPPAVTPVFRDRDELQAGTDLQQLVRVALAQSRYLIVLCSPAAAQSAWVNQEIIEFKKLHGESRVLAVIAAGKPFASHVAGQGHEECFPAALRSALTPDGTAGGVALEPIAADLRPQGDGVRRAALKLIAGMVGVGADQLIRRDARRRMQQLIGLTVASLLGMAAMTVLTVTAVRARNEAQLQRGEAEDLLEFMLGDLRKKLDPVGRLDVLDSLGEKALAYYARQEPDRLDANALGRRSRALQLIGEMREARGQLDQAQLAFQRAADTTARLLQLAPNDAQRIFDHAQSVYWVGHLAWLRAQLPTAESAFRNYVRLAERLVQLDGKNPEWIAETAYAHENVGVICLETSRLAEALEAFSRTRASWERILAAQPSRALELANTMGWMAKTHEAQGNFARAIEAQKEKLHVLETVPNATTSMKVRRSLCTINGELARLELILGQPKAALPFALTAVQGAQSLVAADPANKSWLEQHCLAAAILAETQLANGDRPAARSSARLAREGSAKLLALDPKMAQWQVTLRGRALYVATLVADDEERRGLTNELQDYLAKVQEFTTADRVLDQTRRVIVARNELLLGTLLAGAGQQDEAVVHWRAVAVHVQALAEKGDWDALTLDATAQFHLGSVAAARTLAQRIESSAYRHPAFADLIRLLAADPAAAVAPPIK
ncbi:MAG: TIR domain-containing protein [Opitutae bacterium]